MTQEELKLRELLWLHHGCESPYFYGDDGEMQCNNIPKHIIDFRRDSADDIELKLCSPEMRRVLKAMRETG